MQRCPYPFRALWCNALKQGAILQLYRYPQYYNDDVSVLVNTSIPNEIIILEHLFIEL